jgi:hypothetical protein
MANIIRTAYTYGAKVHLARKDAAEMKVVQMGNTVRAEDADEAKEEALIECSFSAAENFPAWKLLKIEVFHIARASDCGWA